MIFNLKIYVLGCILPVVGPSCIPVLGPGCTLAWGPCHRPKKKLLNIKFPLRLSYFVIGENTTLAVELLIKLILLVNIIKIPMK